MGSSEVVSLDKKTQARGRMAAAASDVADTETKADKPAAKAEIPSNVSLPIESLVEGDNPRQLTDADADKELVASIRRHGILQPLRVRPTEDGMFKVIAGARRFAGAKEAKLKMVPVFIAIATDDDAYVQSLVENVQRANLNPIDEAKAFLRLLADGKLTQKQVGAIVAKSQSYVANAIGLLEASPEVQEALQAGKLNVASAKALRSLPAERQTTLLARATKGEVNSKDIEAAAAEERRRVSQADAEEKRQVELIARINGELKSIAGRKGFGKGTTVVLSEYSVKELSDLDVPKGLTVIRRNWNQMTSRGEGFEYDCSCKAWQLGFQSVWRNGEQSPEEAVLAAICIVPEHKKAWDKKKSAVKSKAESEATAKVKTLRNDLEPNLMATATELSEEGYRLLGFSIIVARPKMAAAFCKKQGIEHPKVQQYDQRGDAQATWAAVEKAPLSQVVDAIASVLLDIFVVDVYRAYADDVRAFAHVRAWLADRFALDKAFVYGGREKELQVGKYAPKEPTEAEMQAEDHADPESDDDEQMLDPEPAVDPADPDNEAGNMEYEPVQEPEAETVAAG